MSSVFEDKITEQAVNRGLEKRKPIPEKPGNKTNTLLERGGLFDDEPEQQDKRPFYKKAITKAADAANWVQDAAKAVEDGGLGNAVAQSDWANRQPEDTPIDSHFNTQQQQPGQGNQQPQQSQQYKPPSAGDYSKSLAEFKRLTPQQQQAYGSVENYIKINTANLAAQGK